MSHVTYEYHTGVRVFVRVHVRVRVWVRVWVGGGCMCALRRVGMSRVTCE